MIKVAHINKIYGDRIAANDISFEIPDGKICGFLGPNGAGKSTTMNIITGYLAPGSGSVLFDDISMITSPIKAKKMVGYLPEQPPLYLDMTVTEYLHFVMDLKKVPKIQKETEFNKIIEKTGLAIMKGRLIKNLSKGYKQRVGLASALVGNPKFLILDEPSNGLDPKQIVEIRSLIEELKSEHTIVLSTHILSEVSAICDYLVIISHGRVMAFGTPEELEERFNRNQLLELCVKANSSTTETVMTGVEGVKEYKIISEIDGCTRFSVVAEELYDLRESLFKLFSDKDIVILEQKVNFASLESVYLKLTSEEHYKELLEKEKPEDFNENEEEE